MRAPRRPACECRKSWEGPFLASVALPGSSGWAVGCDIVRLHPTGRADREAGLGARRELARGQQLAAHERGLGGGKVGAREIALAAIGHGELGIGFGRFRLPPQRVLKQRHRLLAMGVGGDKRLRQQDLNERWVGSELRSVAQWSNRLRWLAAFEQSLALELVEIGVLRVRLNQGV